MGSGTRPVQTIIKKKNDAGLIRLLRVWQTGGSSPMTFLTYDVQEKPVGLKAVRSRHMLLTRITHIAVLWLVVMSTNKTEAQTF